MYCDQVEGLKMREWKMRYGQNARVENAEVKYAGADNRGGATGGGL